jgi:hypothetical protein
MDMLTLLQTIQATPGCIVHPTAGFPDIEKGHILPHDLVDFYRLCGGAILFEEAPFPTDIASPKNLVLANPVIFERVSEEELLATKGHISWSWYIIGRGPNSQYITIDLSPERLGYCYDSFWDRHPGNSYIIAPSFTELLLGLLSTRGEYYYWDEPGFPLNSPLSIKP